MRIAPRRLFILGGALAIAAGGFAFMASNTVGQSNAGEGSASVSGYNVYNITYSGITTTGGGQAGTMQFDENAPVSNGLTGDGVVTTVSFQVSPDNALWSEVQLYNTSRQLIGGGGATNCTESATAVWTCAVTGTDVYQAGGTAFGTGSGVPVSQIAFIDVEAVH